jgi:hypothetical protein
MIFRKKTRQTVASEAFNITNYSSKDKQNVIYDLQNYTKGEHKSSEGKALLSFLLAYGLGIKMLEINKIAGIAIGTLGFGGCIMYAYSCYKYKQDLHILANTNATAEEINPIGRQAIYHRTRQIKNANEPCRGTLYIKNQANNRIEWNKYLMKPKTVSVILQQRFLPSSFEE